MMKKQLRKLWDKVFYGDGLHPPNFCPSCGGKLRDDKQPFWADSARMEQPDDPFRGIGYDCYCENCGWSGDIVPDADWDVVHNIDENGKEYYEGKKDWHRKKD